MKTSAHIPIQIGHPCCRP